MPNTSRKDGVLVLQTDKPYNMAVNGSMVQRNTIICYDINNQAESAAFDLEQYFDAAIFDMADKRAKHDQKSGPDEKDDFFNIDRPSDKDIAEKAMGLEMIVRSNNTVLMSKMLETFNEIISAGLIRVDGDVKMQPTIWNTIHRNDKLKIVFWYSAFFVNPLQRLSVISDIMEGKSEQGVTNDKETQSEQPVLPLVV